MFKKFKPARNKFSIRLGGVRTINSFAAVPVIAHDRLRQKFNECETQEEKWRLWRPKRIRVA